MNKNKNYKMNVYRTIITILSLVFLLFMKHEIAFAYENTFQQHLIQTTSDKEMWESYIRLGMEKLYIKETDSFEQITEKVMYSCVHLGSYKDMDETNTNGYGVGFILNVTNDELYIVAANHVVQDATYGKVKVDYFPEEFNEKTFNMQGLGETPYEQIQKELHTATVVYQSKICDFAMVVVDISNLDYIYRYNFQEISKFPNEPIPLNESLYFYTSDMYGKNIKMKTFKTIEPGAVVNDFKEQFFWTTPASRPGDSGSLVFNEKAEVVSIIRGGVTGPYGNFNVSVELNAFVEECKKCIDSFE